MDLLREKLIEYLSSFKECISEDIVKDNLKSKMKEPFNESDISHEGFCSEDICSKFIASL